MVNSAGGGRSVNAFGVVFILLGVRGVFVFVFFL